MRLDRISWPDAQEYFKQNDTVIIPIGSIESHGTHNVLGVDTLIPNKIVDLMEKIDNTTLIAPTLPYGSCDSLSDFPGTINLGVELLYSLVKQITDELYRHGARKFIYLNGHGGNISALDRVCIELSKKDALGVQMNWWLMAWDLNPSWKGGHGGAEETAAMLAVDPSLVRFDRLEEMNLINDISDSFPIKGFKNIEFRGIEVPAPRMVTRFSSNGWIGNDHPKEATEQWGKEMLDAVAEYICAFIAQFKQVALHKNSSN